MFKHNTSHSLVIKLSILTLLLLVSAVPRSFVDSLVDERRNFEESATNSILASSHAAHSVGSVKFRVPYFHFNCDTKTKKCEKEFDDREFLPTKLKIAFKDAIEIRKRGIFKIPVYKGDLDMSGEFTIPKDLDPQLGDEQPTQNAQSLSFGFAHAEAISDFAVTMNGVKVEAERIQGGLKVDLHDVTFKPGETVSFKVYARLDGYGSLTIATAARELEIDMQSQWPHPSFTGQLPRESTVTEKGFSAHWKLMQASEAQSIVTSYMEPVNVYTQVSRALKYGFLITLLCLAVVFLMETLAGLKIHGMQYFLMTLPLTCFYVLLLAAAEHIGFNLSYMIASAAVVGLLYFYLSGAGATKGQARMLGATLSGVYALILTMLMSEDYALLIGSLTLFACLAAFMLMTRKVNWAELRSSSKESHELA